MNECTVLMKLRQHPNIVRVLEHFVDDGRLCIVMEYADGGDLAQRIEAQAASKGSLFPENQVVDWFVQICLALKHAHDRKILHRDLKPQNIFLTRKNYVRLGDFGISKVLSNTLAVASTCVGTPLYLAPELCEGKEYDGKSDVWSLGAILYELCALSPPFTANTMPALVMRICGEEPPSLDKQFSPDVRNLASTLLSKDPSLRPRIHDILQIPFILHRIEGMLSPEDLIEEFSHTIIHAGGADDGGGGGDAADGGAPAAAAGARSGSATKGRPKSGAPTSSKPPMGKTGGKPPMGKTGGGGKTMGKTGGGGRKQSPGPAEPEEETPAQRALRIKEAEDRREAMRAQMRADRRAQQASSTGKTMSAFEIVMAQAPPVGSAGALPNVVAVEPDAVVRRALQAAHPGTRLLSDAERRTAQENLTRRQQEIVMQVQSSQLKGEAGRAMLNTLQRELLEIARIRSAVSKAYVLVRTDPSAATAGVVSDEAGDGSTVAGVPIDQVCLAFDTLCLEQTPRVHSSRARALLGGCAHVAPLRSSPCAHAAFARVSGRGDR